MRGKPNYPKVAVGWFIVIQLRIKLEGYGGWSYLGNFLTEVGTVILQNRPIWDSSSIGRALQREGILLLNALDIGSSPVYLTSPIR